MFSTMISFTWVLLLSGAASTCTDTLPKVDLGYEIHKAISFNHTTGTYNFTNIRYAEPPLGPLRFAAPKFPQGRKLVVQDGSTGKICPQATPAWQTIGIQFGNAYATGQLPFNYTAAAEAVANMTSATPTIDPRTTEDCLVLDVIVPKSAFDSRNDKKGVPVLVWIYGGGYTFGTKELYGSPNGLISTSQSHGSEGIIYVAMNYRLGAFGFLGGPTLQTSSGVANVGLYDQRLAIEWVRNHISKFGGDPEKITLLGESAGGSSVMHQITAFGGHKPVPFQRAISQSPGYIPLPGPQEQETTFQQFLGLLNVSTLAEARQLPSEAVILANYQHISAAPYGTYIYGPVVDDLFVPGIPTKLLLQGSFATDVSIMAGHNSHEGVLFIDPRLRNESDIEKHLKVLLPDIREASLSYILNDLYPPIYNGSEPYMTFFDRLMLIYSEMFFLCNANSMVKAATQHLASAYEYQFSVPPGLHGQDLAYTFYTSPAPGVVTEIAELLQHYIVTFAQSGVPSANAVSKLAFPLYGDAGSMLDLNVSGPSIMKDTAATIRCDWWEKALYY